MNELGRIGEELASKHLEKRGYSILETNYRYKKAEIDIIALSSESILVFVEVKTRSGIDYGNPEESIDKKKRELIKSAAEDYMLMNETDLEIRFDVIAILKQGEEYEIEHIRDAFD